MTVFDVMTPETVHMYAIRMRHPYSSVIGDVVYGIQYAICGNKNIERYVDGATADEVMVFTCTKLQYETFKETVERLYPGACKYDE